MTFAAVAPAKVTLTLAITGRRADGYHLLDAVVVFTEFGDRLEIKSAEPLSLAITGPLAAGLSNGEDNLIMKAARLMQQHFNIGAGAAISLEKHIPIAAGLGGGSSDAATTMLLLNQLWQIDAPVEKLAQLGAPLGADIPACLYQKPLRMQGIGEQISLLEDFASKGHLLLANPNKALATADVYRAYNPIAQHEASESWMDASNHLQPAAIELCPEVGDVLKLLEQQEGCKVARLCGSGATCFGWFDNSKNAVTAQRAISEEHPHWWIRKTAL